jgi:hypothetical protein
MMGSTYEREQIVGRNHENGMMIGQRKGSLARSYCWALVLVLLGVSATAQAAQTDRQGFDEKTVANFYRGKVVRIIVGFSAGGGYGQYYRLIGQHLSKSIPGNPSVVAQT